MQAVTREYTMSDSELMFMVGDFVVYMGRDAAELVTRGVTALDTTDFENLGNSFELFPPDIYYSAQVTAEVEAKNAARENSYALVQKISGFFEQQWGLDAWQYTQLGIKGLSNKGDGDFKDICRNVVKTANDQLLNLTAIGLTQADIDALEAEAQTMEDAGHDIKEKKALRDEKTEERAVKGNELYSYVKKYSSIGKLIWENVNEAKYNDYVIYPSTTQMPGKVLNMGYDLPTRTVSWDPAAYAEDYQLERKFHTDPDWTVVYEGADTSVVNDPVTPGTWYYRCRGQNENGYGTWSDELMVLMPN